MKPFPNQGQVTTPPSNTPDVPDLRTQLLAWLHDYEPVDFESTEEAAENLTAFVERVIREHYELTPKGEGSERTRA